MPPIRNWEKTFESKTRTRWTNKLHKARRSFGKHILVKSFEFFKGPKIWTVYLISNTNQPPGLLLTSGSGARETLKEFSSRGDAEQWAVKWMRKHPRG